MALMGTRAPSNTTMEETIHSRIYIALKEHNTGKETTDTIKAEAIMGKRTEITATKVVTTGINRRGTEIMEIIKGMKVKRTSITRVIIHMVMVTTLEVVMLIRRVTILTSIKVNIKENNITVFTKEMKTHIIQISIRVKRLSTATKTVGTHRLEKVSALILFRNFNNLMFRFIGVF